MKKYFFPAFALCAVALAAGCKKEAPALSAIWETERVFRVPESVMYDPALSLLYVSNIDGKPTEKNGKGFISKLGLDGAVVELRWVEGMNAPKGMGIFGGHLYVTDIDTLVRIRIMDGTIVDRYPARGAKFLNDIAIDADGAVYMSDMNANRIYRLVNESLEAWSDAPELENPNGLAFEGTRLLVGVRGGIIAMNPKDGGVSTVVAGAYEGGTDGLRPAGGGAFIVSDWEGRVRLVRGERDAVLLSDTTDQKINAADIEYIPGKRMLLVPTFFDNRVVTFRLTGRR